MRRGRHVVTIQALPELMGNELREFAVYLDSCRALRNTSDYDRVGAVTEAEARELLGEVDDFRTRVVDWLASKHPALSQG